MATQSSAVLDGTAGPEPAAPEPASGTGVAKTYPDGVDPVIEHEEIARLAYSYWETRGSSGGSAEEDWYRAEEELKGRAAGLL